MRLLTMGFELDTAYLNLVGQLKVLTRQPD